MLYKWCYPETGESATAPHNRVIAILNLNSCCIHINMTPHTDRGTIAQQLAGEPQ